MKELQAPLVALGAPFNGCGVWIPIKTTVSGRAPVFFHKKYVLLLFLAMIPFQLIRVRGLLQSARCYQGCYQRFTAKRNVPRVQRDGNNVKTLTTLTTLHSTTTIHPSDHSRHPSNTPPTLTLQDQLHFCRTGSLFLPKILQTSLLQGPVDSIHADVDKILKQNQLTLWQQKVAAVTAQTMEDVERSDNWKTVKRCKSFLSSEPLPFLQLLNPHHLSSKIKSLAFDPLLPSLASKLLDTPNIRLYQTSIFHKRNNDHPTLYHSDLKMTPWDTNKFITFWIPLTNIPKNTGTALQFVDGSHTDFALNYFNTHDKVDEMDLSERYKKVTDYGPMEVGDVTVHDGWVLHCAGGNVGDDRTALTVSYVCR